MRVCSHQAQYTHRLTTLLASGSSGLPAIEEAWPCPRLLTRSLYRQLTILLALGSLGLPAIE
eukprot:1158273-Pelagomonas_calceolata.AAC.9